MAAKKKSKKKKTVTPAKKKTAARKNTKSKKTAVKKAVTKAKKTKKKAAPGMLSRAIKAVKKAVTPAKKKTPKKTVGEGDYEASRTFLKDQAGFVKKNKAKIPELAKQAEKDLDGPEGDELRAAEEAGRSHSVAGKEE